MVDNGELEFFEFTPSDFLNDLQSSIDEVISKFVDTEFGFAKAKKKKMILGILDSSAKKNLFLFRNFVLKNILCFPPKFNFDRKINYVEEKQVDVSEYSKQIEKLSKAHTRLNQLILRKMLVEYENKQLKEILKGEDDLKEMSLCLLNLKDKFRKIQEYVKRIPFCSLNDEDFNSLLEHRELRTEMFKKELEKLQESVDIDYLSGI